MKLFFRVAGILVIIISILWLIVKPGFDSLVAVLTALIGLGSLIGSFVIDMPKEKTETLDQRNRRIMLNHVEEFWVKGILEKSLYGAALLDLGIKEDPDALNYPWTIKREASHESLPLGKPMIEIFQEIGLGRSLLILGAPGSGKTTMMLELTRQLIDCARKDVTEPVPVVFNLSSWTEKQTLAEWLVTELNAFYNVPQKMAPSWINDNKMLLLLDGLDEVQKEIQYKCVAAINTFRKDHGLISMVVCSRSQEYAELKVHLSFDGAIEIQPLTIEKVEEYLDRFGNQLAGIRLALQKDTALCEMVESPLFLSIMTLAYRDKKSAEIILSENVVEQRKHLFDTYIARMFERPERTKNVYFEKQDIVRWLAKLAQKMIAHKQVPYLPERMQPDWLNQKRHLLWYQLIVGLIVVLILTPITAGGAWEIGNSIGSHFSGPSGGHSFGLICGLVAGLFAFLYASLSVPRSKILTVDILTINWQSLKSWIPIGLFFGFFSWLLFWLQSFQIVGLTLGPCMFLLVILYGVIDTKQLDQTAFPGQRLSFSIRNFFFIGFIFFVLFGLTFILLGVVSRGLIFWGIFAPIGGFLPGLVLSMGFGGFVIIQHYTLRLIMNITKLLPWKLIPFLDCCTDLIFLRRVGGGYIFVHRLLMEHFAKMYTNNT